MRWEAEAPYTVTASIEHPSVLATCRWLESLGFVVTYLPVGREGIVDPADLAGAITADTCLVSIMAANNETGALQPVAELAAIAKEKGVLFHADAVQTVGKIPVDVEGWGVDFLTLSGHKFHGPKGAGAVYVRKGVEPAPLITGNRKRASGGGRRTARPL